MSERVVFSDLKAASQSAWRLVARISLVTLLVFALAFSLSAFQAADAAAAAKIYEMIRLGTVAGYDIGFFDPFVFIAGGWALVPAVSLFRVLWRVVMEVKASE